MCKTIKNIILINFLIAICLTLSSCNEKSDFSITFIDVGQGDAALVSCEGHHMLIDGGPKSSEDKVYNLLVDKNVTTLDYLIISHMHEDHIGGLQKALTYVSTVNKTLSVEMDDDADEYYAFHKELLVNGCNSIDIPIKGEEFELGSAIIKVIYVGDPNIDENESLVILITYGQTTFLFTGDINYKAEGIISDEYSNNFPITLLKVSHHGASESTEYRFIRTTEPKYAVISVGKNNIYGHPTEKVLSVLDQAEVKTYRTDLDGTITVTSNGKNLTIKTEK